MERVRLWAIPWHSVRFTGLFLVLPPRPVFRAAGELAKMTFQMRERVMKKVDVSEPGRRALRSNERR